MELADEVAVAVAVAVAVVCGAAGEVVSSQNDPVASRESAAKMGKGSFMANISEWTLLKIVPFALHNGSGFAREQPPLRCVQGPEDGHYRQNAAHKIQLA